MRIKIPSPISGGLILSYTCSAECRHCIYACSKKWAPDWISENDLEKILSQLSGKIMPSPFGTDSTGLNHGLHFTGGEPFVNFNLLSRAVETAHEYQIPSTFVETNCYWAVNDEVTEGKLMHLKSRGLQGIMISVNPFYLEYIPFERTERAVRFALELFGRNVMVYQFEYFRRFKVWGLKDRVSFKEYLKLERKSNFLRNVEFLIMGRAPYKLEDELKEIYPRFKANFFFRDSCMPPFLRTVHNHFDNYGNYMPGFCGGISLGDCRDLDPLLDEGIEIEEYPVLKFLIEDSFSGLLSFAREYGYTELKKGYFSKCHLCIDIRKFLIDKDNFKELKPVEFYMHLN
jgi:MoaA/NifB/PqqE/SkfB family radical SAM enzyme